MWARRRRKAADVHGFGFHTLALLTAVGLAGPLLASLPRLRIPVIIGELVAGLVIGKTGFGVVDDANPTFQLFANIGFALVMFVVGTHVPVRDPADALGGAAGVGAGGSGRCRRGGARCRDGGGVRHRPRGALCGADGFVVGGAGIAGDRFAGACGDRKCYP